MSTRPRSVSWYVLTLGEFCSDNQWIFLLLDHSIYCAFQSSVTHAKEKGEGMFPHRYGNCDHHDDKGPGGYGRKARASFAEHITGRSTAPHTFRNNHMPYSGRNHSRIFKYEVKMEAACSFETLVSAACLSGEIPPSWKLSQKHWRFLKMFPMFEQSALYLILWVCYLRPGQ